MRSVPEAIDGRRGGRQARHAFRWKRLGHIKRDAVGRVERCACGQNARPGHFPGFDPLPQGESVSRHGGEVHDSREAEPGEHRLELFGKLLRGFGVGRVPLGFGEVHVAVPKTRHDGLARTVDLLAGRRDCHLTARTDRGNHPVPDNHHRVTYG